MAPLAFTKAKLGSASSDSRTQGETSMHRFITPKFIAISGAAHAGVVNCDADGNRQRNGAIIGGIAGAIIGNNVSHKSGAPIVGAVAGAAAGSAIGCNQQKMMARDKEKASYIGNSVATA